MFSDLWYRYIIGNSHFMKFTPSFGLSFFKNVIITFNFNLTFFKIVITTLPSTQWFKKRKIHLCSLSQSREFFFCVWSESQHVHNLKTKSFIKICLGFFKFDASMRWKKLECTLFQFYKFFEFDVEMTFYHHFSSHECLPFTQVWWNVDEMLKVWQRWKFLQSYVFCLVLNSFFFLPPVKKFKVMCSRSSSFCTSLSLQPIVHVCLHSPSQIIILSFLSL
jgi:hypothetical protein